MGLSEEDVFQRVANELTNRGYRFFVHCDYNSIRSKYRTHSIMISNGIPDILGITPDELVFAIEVKGSSDIKKGKGQAINYKAGSNVSYLAAEATAIEKEMDALQSAGLGAIGVGDNSVDTWVEPLEVENKTALPEVRSRLLTRLNDVGSFTKIANLNLAHPANFFEPVLFLESHIPSWDSVPKDEFDEEFATKSHLGGSAISDAVDGAVLLGLVEYGPRVRLSDQGRLALLVLREYDVTSLDELEAMIDQTSHRATMHQIAPLLAEWLLDQYRKHADFEALYRMLLSFDERASVPLTELSARLIQDHPNTFLRLFCTRSPNSRDRARGALLDGQSEDLYRDLDTFREVIRQNLFHNFSRQLQHLGVLSPETASTTEKLENIDPGEYPWILPTHERQARFF